jgi:glycerol kinase
MSQTPAILALDQGTTGSTAIVISDDGRILGRAYSEFSQHFPRAGWVEHDAEEIWRVTVRVAREALEAARNRESHRVEGIGITNQRETIVVWDRSTGDPVHRAIVWQDRRTAGICKELKEGGHEKEFRRRTGLVLDPYFSGTKLTWLLREVPGLRARAEGGELACGTIDTWLVHRLTGGKAHATDHTNASRTLLYDLASGAWEEELLDLLEVPEGMLPAIRTSAADFGVADGELLGIEAPIAGVAGDQQAALFGQGCWHAGLAKNTYGTGAFLLLHTGEEPVASEHGLLSTVACGPRGERNFALEGSIFIAGAAIQWLRDSLELLPAASDSEEMARSLEGNDGVYFVPAFVGLGAPHWDPEVRGAILGLTRGTSSSHLVRAALEAMAYGTVEVLRAQEADSGVPARELRVDGGAADNDWLMQFQSDLLGIPVRRPALVETTSLGAAGLAGISTGLWASGQDFLEAQGPPRIFAPRAAAAERKRLQEGWERAVGAARSFRLD